MIRIVDIDPLVLWHIRQAGECDRLAAERKRLGDERGAAFWARIYQDKLGDAWKSRPSADRS